MTGRMPTWTTIPHSCGEGSGGAPQSGPPPPGMWWGNTLPPPAPTSKSVLSPHTAARRIARPSSSPGLIPHASPPSLTSLDPMWLDPTEQLGLPRLNPAAGAPPPLPPPTALSLLTSPGWT